MRNTLCVLVCFCFLPVSCFAQKELLPAVKTLLNETVSVPVKVLSKSVNVSSSLLRVRYQMSSNNLQVLQQVYAQQGVDILMEPKLEEALRMAQLDALNSDAAKTLLGLENRVAHDYALWGEALLRERNPNFFSAKDPSIPSLFEVPPVFPLHNDLLTPRFFREWAALIPAYDTIPEDVNVLVAALRRKIGKAEVDLGTELKKFYSAKSRLEKSEKLEENRQARRDMTRSMNKIKSISKETAQQVADLLHLINLYPTLYADNIKQLAVKLDALPKATPFSQYIRKKIAIPVPPPPTRRKKIGFIGDNE